MAALPQYTYIFGIAVCFAFLDAWNIGANDVANSFATSVSSRSLTMVQAMTIGAIMEFSGAVLAGARVSGTIKSGIIKVSAFEDKPSVLMLGMLCALVGSSLFLTFATKIGLPVSTTHCIIGGIIGVGFATVGPQGVDWSWRGVSQVFAAWLIAPCISAAFGSILFLITKYCVVKSKKPVIAGLLSIPIYFAITSGILTMLIVWKGAASLNLDNWGIANTAGTIFGVAGGVALLASLFIVPHAYVILVREDWTVKKWEVIKGPFLLRRPAPPPMPEGHQLVPDYYRGHRTLQEIEEHGAAVVAQQSDEESDRDAIHPSEKGVPSQPLASTTSKESSSAESSIQGKWWEPVNILRNIKWFFFRGVMMDVVSAQSADKKPTFITRLLTGKNLEKKHALVTRYDNRVEHLYSLLQVMTAATASFAHGANDVSNAMGPFSAIFQIWQTNTTAARSEVPIWILAFGGGSIALGLWTYGYKLMQNLGNRITLHSPIRGFCMELGAAITVVLATRLALPVSTTQCIIGATVGVGLCSGEIKAVNWRVVSWSYFAWFVTLPSTAVIAGLLMAFTINAPQWTRPE